MFLINVHNFTFISKNAYFADCSQDRLSNEWKHADRDEGLAKEEREQFEDVINDETKDIDTERSATKKVHALCRKNAF